MTAGEQEPPPATASDATGPAALEAAASQADEFWLFGYGSLIWKPPPHFAGFANPFLWDAGSQTGGYPDGSPATSGDFGSQDHRGTPEAPGRVVTLIERAFWEQLTDHHASAPERVWGTAYRIHADKVEEVREYLDIREINGYTIHYTPFHPAPLPPQPGEDGESSSAPPARPQQPFPTLVYIGTPDNDQFTGPQDPQALAEHIHRSEGPSGLNRDYLWELEAALAALSPESGDEHVTDLSNRVRAIEQQRKKEQERSGEAAAEAEGEAAAQTETADILRSPPPVFRDHPQTQTQSQTHTHTGTHHEFHRVSSVDEQEETEKAF